MPTCPNCGAPYANGVATCDECGATLGEVEPPRPAHAPVASVCPNCGAKPEPGSKFCDMCGTPLGDQTPAPAPSHKPPPPSKPARTPLPTKVTIIQGKLVLLDTGSVIQLPPGKTEIIIGRGDPTTSATPHVDVGPHGGRERGVSRRHARIIIRGGSLFIEDLNSTNHTYVNRRKLAPGQPHPLASGDEVQLGWFKVRFEQ
jgi:hypothetical protein